MDKLYRILKLVIAVLIFAIVMVGAGKLYDRLGSTVSTETLAETQPEEQKETAPDFTVYDRDGKAWKLSDFVGKPVVLNFWASWCGPCQMEMPDFEEQYLAYGEDIHFLMVNLTDGRQETVETAAAFIEDAGYTFPVYFDRDMDAAITYSVNAVPVTYFIDAQGALVTYRQGMLSAEVLKSGIDLLLK